MATGSRFLNVSQPSLSRSLQRLEDQLGLPLFHRHRKRLLPSAEARRLFDEVDPIIARMRALTMSIAHVIEGPTSLFRFAHTQSVGRHLVSHAVGLTTAQQTELKVFPDALPRMKHEDYLLGGKGECLVTLARLDHPSLVSRDIARTPLVAVLRADHPLAALDRLHPQDFSGIEVIAFEHDGPHLEASGRFLDRQSRPPPPREVAYIRFADAGVAPAAQGGGVALLDGFTTAGEMPAGLVLRRLAEAPRFTARLYWNGERPGSRFVQTFGDALVRAVVLYPGLTPIVPRRCLNPWWAVSLSRHWIGWPRSGSMSRPIFPAPGTGTSASTPKPPRSRWIEPSATRGSRLPCTRRLSRLRSRADWSRCCASATCAASARSPQPPLSTRRAMPRWPFFPGRTLATSMMPTVPSPPPAPCGSAACRTARAWRRPRAPWPWSGSSGATAEPRIRADGGFLTLIPDASDLWWLGIDVETNWLDGADLACAERDGRLAAWHGVAALRAALPGFENAHVAATGPRIGIRESRHAAARAPLLEATLIDARRPDDTVALGSWPMEIHHGPGRTEYRGIGGDGVYGIGLGALQVAGLGNLWLGGRTLGAEPAAYASARVMGTAFATGHAAGVAAALPSAATEAVQRELLRQDAVL